MEHLRGARRSDALIEEMRRQSRGGEMPESGADDDSEIREKMLSCLEQCTAKLESLNREIITRYYTGKERVKIENRRALAEELGVRTRRHRERFEDSGLPHTRPSRRLREALHRRVMKYFSDKV